MSASQSQLRATIALLNETPPPSLREILQAYRTKGDGDRELLLALLKLQTSENERLGNVAALHRSVLELSQLDGAQSLSSPGPSMIPGHYHSSGFSENSRRHSPPHPYHRSASHHRSSHLEPPPKRHRSSQSPGSFHVERPQDIDASHGSQNIPLSPYSTQSSNGPSSPRSTHRGSMAIGSLLRLEDGNEGHDLKVNGHHRDVNRDTVSRILQDRIKRETSHSPPVQQRSPANSS